MKVWSAIAIAAVVLIAATLLDGQAPPPAAPAPAAPVSTYPGRYQMVIVNVLNSNPDIWMIDSQTGDTWRRAGGRWLYAGNPTQEPGTKFPTPSGRGRAAIPPAPVLPESPTP